MKNRMTFSPKLDDHPALKGEQHKLPDQIQKKILKSHMKKMSALTELEEEIRDAYLLTPAIGAVSSIISYNKQKNKLRKLGMTDDEIREALQGNALNAAVRGGAIGVGTQLIPRKRMPDVTKPLGKLSRGSVPILGALASYKYEAMRGNRAERRFNKNKG